MAKKKETKVNARKDYDYANYNTYLRYKFSLADINWFVNTAISLTDYSYLDDLDNLLGNVGISFNKSFETKTTLLGGINYNYKNYLVCII